MFKCICGFSTTSRKQMISHKMSCQKVKEYKSNLFSNLRNLDSLLKRISLKEWYDKYVDKNAVSYVTCLKKVKSLVEQGLLEYDFNKNPMKTESGKKRFKRTMIKRYSVDNPSKLEHVRQKQRNAQLKRWSDNGRLIYAQKLYETRGVYNVKQDKSSIKQLTLALNVSDYEQLLRIFYNVLKNSTSVDWIEDISFDQFYKTKLGDRKNMFMFKCKNCKTIFSRYIASPLQFLYYLYVVKLDSDSLIVCPCCGNKKRSKLESFFITLIRQNSPNINVKQHVKLQNNYEIDIVINDQLGIEIDGLYWHSTAHIKSSSNSFDDFKHKLYNYRKRVEAKIRLYRKLPYKVLTIDEYSLFRYQDTWLTKTLYELGRIDTKVNARSCEIVRINEKNANDFHNRYNIRGRIYGSILNLGLCDNDDNLIAVMSVNKCSSRKSLGSSYDLEYEISRFTVKPYVIVRGGMTKLIKHVKRILNVNKLLSFVDGRLSSKCPVYGEVLTKPQLTYFVVNHNDSTLRHRLYLRKINRNNIPEDLFIWRANEYDVYYSIGSWKLAV